MNNSLPLFGMAPFSTFFPQEKQRIMSLDLPQKVGKLPAGHYDFVERYCVKKSCDCRRTVPMVFNEKDKNVASIEFGFDLEDELAGPYLSTHLRQTAHAKKLLKISVDCINDNDEKGKDFISFNDKCTAGLVAVDQIVPSVFFCPNSFAHAEATLKNNDRKIIVVEKGPIPKLADFWSHATMTIFEAAG